MIAQYKRLINQAMQVVRQSGACSLDDTDPDSRLYQDQWIAISFNPIDKDLEVFVAANDGPIRFNDRCFQCVLCGWEDSPPDIYRLDLSLLDGSSWANYLETVLSQLEPPTETRSPVSFLKDLAATPDSDLEAYLIQLTQLQKMGVPVANWVAQLLTRLADLPPHKQSALLQVLN